ncbi:putative two-component sensor histidine kinase [Paenibacillus mucilaginosus 3016]|uniref:histidine kinase n=1 Tax=Paenibacillus mucilaginosus 3016 TaxID=1116391 RepID=H6NC96_9BACL|nr:HAMP domain-containing sensor histidine kinase [Paenibacillus mucilaginosus]AFC28289.1 putative two-component sensor histidine kinase [Paenibacillus mucilaginosus 3016]WFA17097.1 HAMP domain-containing histidine kinase [Paenibacillus mucilaginosus]
MSLFKEIILQLFFALAPFVIYNIYYRDKLRNYSPWFILATSSACLLLSMTFASSRTEGLIFDIRYVMIFFSLVYGGLQTLLILLIEFAAYRMYIGGQGAPVSLLIVASAFGLSLILHRWYRNTYRKALVTFVAGIVFASVPLIMVYFFFPVQTQENLPFHLFVIPLQNALGIWLLMSLFSKAVADKELFIKHAQHEKFETMSHVAASLAHEVRNPLTAVKGFLKLIRENPENRVKMEQYITISLEEIQRTETILSDYLSISKPHAQRRELIDLCGQMQAIGEVMSPFANMHNVGLEIQKPEEAVRIKANPDEIKQVLLNFIKNAVEACSEVPNGRVILRLTTEDRHAVLTIKDNGVGMSESQINRLGSIYFSTKTNGTGLGLTYSYQVIHALGGSVMVTSKAQVGTKFAILLPLGSVES